MRLLHLAATATRSRLWITSAYWCARRVGAPIHDCSTQEVRGHEYRRTMLHAKTTTVDGACCTVGSINMDSRANTINDELNSGFSTRRSSASWTPSTEDVEHSDEIDPARWRRRPPLDRVKEAAAGALRAKL